MQIIISSLISSVFRSSETVRLWSNLSLQVRPVGLLTELAGRCRSMPVYADLYLPACERIPDRVYIVYQVVESTLQSLPDRVLSCSLAATCVASKLRSRTACCQLEMENAIWWSRTLSDLAAQSISPRENPEKLLNCFKIQKGLKKRSSSFFFGVLLQLSSSAFFFSVLNILLEHSPVKFSYKKQVS